MGLPKKKPQEETTTNGLFMIKDLMPNIEKISKLKFIWSIVGIITGLLCAGMGTFLALNGLSTQSNWILEIVGLKSNLTNATPGIIMIVTGMIIIYITRFKSPVLKIGSRIIVTFSILFTFLSLISEEPTVANIAITNNSAVNVIAPNILSHPTLIKPIPMYSINLVRSIVGENNTYEIRLAGNAKMENDKYLWILVNPTNDSNYWYKSTLNPINDRYQTSVFGAISTGFNIRLAQVDSAMNNRLKSIGRDSPISVDDLNGMIVCENTISVNRVLTTTPPN